MKIKMLKKSIIFFSNKRFLPNPDFELSPNLINLMDYFIYILYICPIYFNRHQKER